MAQSGIASGGIEHHREWPPFSIVAALVGYGIVLFAPPVLNDPDTYWHIAAGIWMLEHHAIPHADPFSYTLAGAPWVAHEWLAEVLMALAYRASGWTGIAVLFGIATATTFGVLARYLGCWLRQPASGIVFLLGAACLRPSLLARPHLMALAALTIWAAGLLNAKDDGATPSPWLLVLMAVWANLHASFIFGIFLTLPIAMEAIVEAKPARVSIARRWGLFIAAAIGASMLTPHGPHGLLFPFQLVRLVSISSISEWSPINFQTLQPLECALVALLYVALSRTVRLPIGRMIVLLAVLHLALQHSRHQMLAGIVGAIVLAKPLGAAFGDARLDGSIHRLSMRWILSGAACVAFLTGMRLLHPIERAIDGVALVNVRERWERCDASGFPLVASKTYRLGTCTRLPEGEQFANHAVTLQSADRGQDQ